MAARSEGLEYPTCWSTSRGLPASARSSWRGLDKAIFHKVADATARSLLARVADALACPPGVDRRRCSRARAAAERARSAPPLVRPPEQYAPQMKLLKKNRRRIRRGLRRGGRPPVQACRHPGEGRGPDR